MNASASWNCVRNLEFVAVLGFGTLLPGITGLGELNPSAPRQRCLDSLDAIANRLEGCDLLRLDQIHRRFPSLSLDPPSVFAFSAIEQALWDIRGKAVGWPL